MGVEYTEPPERDEETGSETEMTAESAVETEMTTETAAIPSTWDECPWKRIRYPDGEDVGYNQSYGDDIDNEFPEIYESDPA